MKKSTQTQNNFYLAIEIFRLIRYNKINGLSYARIYWYIITGGK